MKTISISTLQVGQISKAILLISGAALLTGLCAHVKIPLPFTPVPITLQTSAVIFVGALLGAWKGSLSQILMLAAGALGAPFFTSGSAAIFGPTAGYLFGFVFTALAAGLVYRPNDSIVKTYIKMLLVSFVVFVPGVSWLKFYTQTSWAQAIQLGLIPFLVGDLIKTGVSTIALRLSKS